MLVFETRLGIRWRLFMGSFQWFPAFRIIAEALRLVASLGFYLKGSVYQGGVLARLTALFRVVTLKSFYVLKGFGNIVPKFFKH